MRSMGRAATAVRVLSVIAWVAAGTASAADFKSGEVIVKYRDGARRSRIEMNALYDAAGVKSVRRFTGIMKGLDQVILSEGVKVQDAIAAFASDPSVEYAQPNYLLHAFPVRESGVPEAQGGIPCIPGIEIPGCDPNAPFPGFPGGDPNQPMPCWFPGIPFPPGCTDEGTPPGGNPPPANRPELQPAPADIVPAIEDPDLAKAYGLGKIGAPDAWKLHRGSRDFIVADIDTGIDYNHEDLAFNLWRGKDAAGKEYVGYDFIHNDNLPFDDQGHGTHTAGTIGAVGGNGKGISGVAQRVSVMSLKFLNGEGSGTTADAIRAIDFAIEHGAKVLSNSWGGRADSNNQALFDAIERTRVKGVLFIAAAGNGDMTGRGIDNDVKNGKESYPAAFDNDNLISVAATDSNDGLAAFSNYGKRSTHLAAPGVGVLSTMPGGKYKAESGTSMACPHVAGAAALLWSKHPEWDYRKVKAVLMSSTDKIAALQNKTVSGGRLNVLKALRSTE